MYGHMSTASNFNYGCTSERPKPQTAADEAGGSIMNNQKWGGLKLVKPKVTWKNPDAMFGDHPTGACWPWQSASNDSHEDGPFPGLVTTLLRSSIAKHTQWLRSK